MTNLINDVIKKAHLSVLKDERGNTVFKPLKDELSNTICSITVKNADGEEEVKPIYIPAMYIAATTYRKIFREMYPYGRIATEILHKENGENFSVNTLEEKGVLTQEVIKVSLYENREDQSNNLPISEGYGSIYYRAEEGYNNNGISTAQGKAFANAMKNLGICLEETEEATKEMLRNVQAYIEVEGNEQVENGGKKTYYKAIGPAIKYYDELHNIIYKEDFSSERISLEKEATKEPTKVVNKEKVQKQQQEAIKGSLKAVEYEEPADEKESEEKKPEIEPQALREEPADEKESEEKKPEIEPQTLREEPADEKESEEDYNLLDFLEKENPEEENPEEENPEEENPEEEKEEEFEKALKSKLNFKSSFNEDSIKKSYDGRIFEELIENKEIEWLEALAKLKNYMTVKTAKMYDVLAENNFGK